MKEATGELNMTVVTIIMIGAILIFFYAFWPMIQGQIQEQWGDATENQNDNSVSILVE